MPPTSSPGDGAAPVRPTDPGLVPAHRLNRFEYENTLRDLLGAAKPLVDQLPMDSSAFGFDNNAAALQLSSLHLLAYEANASSLVDQALAPGATMRAALLPCDLGTPGCLGDALRAFARRAWRRPPSLAQVEGLVRLATSATSQGGTLLDGLKLGMRAILLSPRFLFRFTPPPDPPPAGAWAIDDFSLASRLSYFVWGSMPDEALLNLAEAGRLREEATLRSELRRMLRDPRAGQGLSSGFAAQWLHTRAIPLHKPDLETFPLYDEALGRSMVAGMDAFFGALLEGGPIETLVRGDFVHVDRKLAAIYGLEASSMALTRTSAPRGRRAGVLGQAGVLMITSERSRTSPVKRGAWVLESLLCSPPPPPPPLVEGLDRTPAPPTATVRQRLERHRADPGCAVCHNLIDPLGFGLEGFDAIGRARSTENGSPLDTRGTLPDGRAFEGAEQLGAILAADPRLPHCVAHKLLTYALGRGLEGTSDDATVAQVEAAALRAGGGLPDFVEAVVLSQPFRMQGPEPKETK